jgi:sugar (glycoside-pentoside-hexuronide) transporter
MSFAATPPTPPAPLPTWRLVLLSSGDFGCNLFWQSVSFFLLFFYTDVIGLRPAQAGAVLALGAVWNGLADVVVGAWVEDAPRYRRFVVWAAAPLGVAFAGLYLAPRGGAGIVLAVVVVAHLAFRALYALVNIPFSALSARVTRDSGERGRIAAFRMLFGAAAAFVVAFVTRRFAQDAHGGLTDAGGYARAALLFAAVGALLLVVVGRTAPPEAASPRRAAGAAGLARRLSVLARNPAFTTLVLAAALATVGGGVLNGAVIYYFTYVARAPEAAPGAMAGMALAGVLAVPVWMRLRDAAGGRALWLLAATAALVLTGVFVTAGGRGALAAQAYLVAMQAVMTGLVYAFWAMLPDTVEWGERRSGVRVEALAFGAALLTQKVAAGASAAILGAVFAQAGYHAGAPQRPATDAAIRLAMTGAPALGAALSALVMLASPMRRGARGRLRDAPGEGAVKPPP